jgi:hypothetical protein
MTTDTVPAGGDPRRLLADTRTFAHRVRLAQRVTWLPLLVLALVTLGAIPVTRWGYVIESNCRPFNGGQACRVWMVGLVIYWLTALALGYAVIAVGYVRVARARGVDARVLPYVITGFGLVVVLTAFFWIGSSFYAPAYDDGPPSDFVLALLRLGDFTGMLGLALLVLAWLERHVALLLFTLGYLVVVLVPINFGWGAHWGNQTVMIPPLVISAGVLLLGSAGFALAQRIRRSR